MILYCLDALVCNLSILLALNTFYGISKLLELLAFFWYLIIAYVLLKLFLFRCLGLYRPLTKYTDFDFFQIITQSTVITSVMGIVLIRLFDIDSNYIKESVIIFDGLISIVTIILLRLNIRYLIRLDNTLEFNIPTKNKNTVIIYGAGSSGYRLAQYLEQNLEYRLLAFVDDNPEMQGRMIRGISIYHPDFLLTLYEKKPFDIIILAISNLNNSKRKDIIKKFDSLAVKFKSIPSLQELLSQQISISQLKNIDITDLLDRKEITPDPNLLSCNITDKSVLVTGAGGSIGSELCRQIIELQPKCLVLFELNEFALYTIDLELKEKNLSVPIYSYLGNITDQLHFENILQKHHIETIYHAAAYKHISLAEINPGMVVYNNVAGTLLTADSALKCRVKNFILISTDKAVRPTNVMGVSKRVAELIIQSFAKRKNSETIFAIVRFGNVLNSSGSVIPLFRKQIVEGKAITLTHKNVTRYFISIPEAVNLVIQAGAMAKGGEIFLLDMGRPMRIYDLAVKMIKLSGMIPEKDIPIKIIGLRPGEKLHEELLINKDSINSTRHPQIFSGHEPMIPWTDLELKLKKLLDEAQNKNVETVIKQLKILVPEFKTAPKNPDISRDVEQTALLTIRGTKSHRPLEVPCPFISNLLSDNSSGKLTSN